MSATDGEDALTDAMRRASRRLAERLDRELVGAWRASYDALVVLHEPPQAGLDPDSETFSLGRYGYVPTDHPETTVAASPDGMSAQVYDLTSRPASASRSVRS